MTCEVRPLSSLRAGNRLMSRFPSSPICRDNADQLGKASTVSSKNYRMRFIPSLTVFALSATILAFQLPAQADMTAKVVSIGDGD